LRSINGTSEPSVEAFAKFLKKKIEKAKDIENLNSYARMLDVDKDG